MGDYVRELTSPTKFGSGPMSGRAAKYTGPVTFVLFFCFYSSTELQPIPVSQRLRTIAQRHVLV